MFILGINSSLSLSCLRDSAGNWHGPSAKYIGDEIFELKFDAVEGATRVLYFFFDGKKAVLTNGFIKKTNKIPKTEKEIAVERRRIYLQTRQGDKL